MTNSLEGMRWRWYWAVALAGAVVFASSGNPQMPVQTFVGFDKLAHFGVFGLIATLVLRSRSVWRRPGWRGWIAVLAVSAFGGTDEWHQSFTPGRSVEWADWIADTSGAALAVALYLHWAWYRRLLEYPVWRRRTRPPEKKEPEAPRLAASGSGEAGGA